MKNAITVFLCFEGEGEPSGNQAPPARQQESAKGEGGERRFTQEEVNRILADDKRKHQERMGQLEVQLQTLSTDKNLSEEQRKSLNEQLEDLRKSYRTKEQEAEHQKKQIETKLQGELEGIKKRADHWEKLYRDETVMRSLQDAASMSEAFNPTQIVSLLKPFTQLKESEGGGLVPMIDFPDIDEKTGEEIRTLRTPADAVQRMKALPKFYGNLFKSNVVSGVGGGQGSAIPDKVDVTALTPEQYRKIRAENPEKLGLPPRRR